MTDDHMPRIIAEKLVDALTLVVACATIAKDLEGQEQLRDYLFDAEDDLNEVIVAFVGGKLAEVK